MVAVHREVNLADAGNLVEQPGHLILRLGVGDFVLQIVDRFVEPLKSMSQNLCARPGGVRERRVTFDEIKQLVDAADSLGGNNAELRKMAAKRVDAHRPLFDQQFARLVQQSASLVAPRS